MIAHLTGAVLSLEADRCIIDVHGVGYLVQASTRTLAALPSPPELARVLVETQVREDAITLFGFTQAAERDWFRMLTAVQGVGAKVALGLLSALAPNDLAAAILAGDRAGLTRAPGVGARLADRILTEMRSKAVAAPTLPGPAPSGERGVAEDALLALIGLGFQRTEAHQVVARIVRQAGADATVNGVIRDSLRELGPRNS